MGVLSSLWEALEVEQEDVDRGIFARLMSGPARLHGKSIQKVVLANGLPDCCDPFSCSDYIDCTQHMLDCKVMSLLPRHTVCTTASQRRALLLPCILKLSLS